MPVNSGHSGFVAGFERKGVKRSFASSTDDQLLGSLLRAVIALHALVDNKATIGRTELEEGGGDEKDEEKDKDKKGKNDEKKDEKDGKNDLSKSDPKGL